MFKKIVVMALLLQLLLVGASLAQTSGYPGVQTVPCAKCSGSGKCWTCGGTGSGSAASCYMCSGTGKCYYCSGLGTAWSQGYQH